MQQISHNRPAADKGIISVARHHLMVNTVSQARMYKLYSLPSDCMAESACGYDCEQLLLALDHSEELFPKFRTPTSLMVQVKNKTQNWAIL